MVAMNNQIAKLIAGTNYNKLEEEARAVIDLVYDQLKVPHLKEITDITWNNRLSRVGGTAIYTYGKGFANHAKPKRGTIDLSTKIFSVFSEEERIQAVGHEAVHIVDSYFGNPHHKKTNGHGPTWVELMKRAGFEPLRYHCADTKLFRKRYETNCSSCGKRWEISSNMMGRLVNGTRGAVCNCKARKYLPPLGWKLMKQEIV